MLEQNGDETIWNWIQTDMNSLWMDKPFWIWADREHHRLWWVALTMDRQDHTHLHRQHYHQAITIVLVVVLIRIWPMARSILEISPTTTTTIATTKTPRRDVRILQWNCIWIHVSKAILIMMMLVYKFRWIFKKFIDGFRILFNRVQTTYLKLILHSNQSCPIHSTSIKY